MNPPPSREVEIDPAHAALLFIDVQNYAARRDGGEYQGLSDSALEERYGFFFRTLHDSALPNMRRLQQACRLGRIEVLYTVIESLTRDGRDRSLDYKISGFNVPRGSFAPRVLHKIAPLADHTVTPHTS